MSCSNTTTRAEGAIEQFSYCRYATVIHYFLPECLYGWGRVFDIMARDKTRQVLLLSAGVLFLIGSIAGVGAVPDADDIFEDDDDGPPPHAGGHHDDGDDDDGPPPHAGGHHDDEDDDDDEDDAGGPPSHANPDND